MSNRKNILAVFEQVTANESVYNGDSSFNTSETLQHSEGDLIIDDDYEDNPTFESSSHKRRKKSIRVKKEPISLVCRWSKCSKYFTNYINYVNHIQLHAVNATINQKGTYKCGFKGCNCKTPTLTPLIKHVAFHGYHERLKNIGQNLVDRLNLSKCTQPEPYDIPLISYNYGCDWDDCGLVVNTIQEFLIHIKEHVDSHPIYAEKNKFLHCLWKGCTSKFSLRCRLSDHLKSHTKEKIIACPMCGHLFASKTKFCDHINRQTPLELNNYQCSECSKLYANERLLRDHMRSHVNHYKCNMCEMTCQTPSILAKHIRYRHINERPFKCNLCDHAFVTKSNLESHLTTHCEEKLVACEECDYKCRSAQTLDEHYLNKHGLGELQIYECHCCMRQFRRGTLLTKHLIVRHGFRWPSGHSRFRYKEDIDGLYRLQTVRYESLEVTREMMSYKPPVHNSIKYKLRKSKKSKEQLPCYELTLSDSEDQDLSEMQVKIKDFPDEEYDPSTNSTNIIITIEDVDEKGNVIKSEIMESEEIYSTDYLQNINALEIERVE